MTEDPTFGPLIAFGLGGVFVELIKDVAFRIHPLTDVDIDEMVAGVRSARILEGYRGGPPGDVPAVKEALGRVSVLVDHFPEIVEMDLNPVMVGRARRGVSASSMPVSGSSPATRCGCPAARTSPESPAAPPGTERFTTADRDGKLVVTYDAGWSSLVARRAHNPKVGGSNPPPATSKLQVYSTWSFFVRTTRLAFRRVSLPA